jgi:hypothetical protein
MPLILPKELEWKWLDPDLTDEEMGELLNFEMPAEQIEYRTVFSIRGRSPRPDGKPKIDFFEFPHLPPLGNDDGTVQKAMF